MVGTGTAAPAPEFLCPHSRLPEPLSTVRAKPHKIEGSGQGWGISQGAGSCGCGTQHPRFGSRAQGRFSQPPTPGCHFAMAFRAWAPNLGFARWQDYLRVCYIVCARACACGVSRGRGEDGDGEQTPIGLCRSCLSQPRPVPGLGASPGRPAAGTRRSPATPPVQTEAPRPRREELGEGWRERFPRRRNGAGGGGGTAAGALEVKGAERAGGEG